MVELDEVVKELIQFKKDHPRKRKIKNPSTKDYFVFCKDLTEEFADAKDISLSRLHLMTTQLKLIKTRTGRNNKGDRIGFGLSTSVTKHLDPEPPRTLFTFGRSKSSGLFNAGENRDLFIHFLTLLLFF